MMDKIKRRGLLTDEARHGVLIKVTLFPLQLLFLSSLLLGSGQAGATVKLLSTAGASADDFASVGNGTPTIYGASTGDGTKGTLCSTDGLNTCDGCSTATTLAICNRRRIDPNLLLRISFKSDNTDGSPLLVLNSDNSLVYSSVTSVKQGNTITLQVSWAEICRHLSNTDQSCRGSDSADFKIGVVKSLGAQSFSSGDDSTLVRISILDPDTGDPGAFDQIDDCTTNDNTDSKVGVCLFTAYPGDEKVFIQMDENSVGYGFPTTTSGQIRTMRFYYSNTGFIQTPSDGFYADVPIEPGSSGGFEIPDPMIRGLTNGVKYYFRVAVLDPAGNEMYFTSDNAVQATCGVLPPAIPVPPFFNTCSFAAIPDNVVGLLSKDVNCFIATAAYGSSLHPLIQDLRAFRNKFLLPFSFGRAFVNWYYSWSPQAAYWLKTHPQWKPFVQVALWPLGWGARVVVVWPYSSFLVVLVFGSLIVFYHRQRKKKGRP